MREKIVYRFEDHGVGVDAFGLSWNETDETGSDVSY